MLIKLIREGLGRIIVFINFITQPKPLKRTQDEQHKVDQAAKTLALYQFYACPFCVKVRRAAHRLNIPLELRDAQKEGTFRLELQNQGGRIKVPCLRIERNNNIQWLYESKTIIEFLENKFSGK